MTRLTASTFTIAALLSIVVFLSPAMGASVTVNNYNWNQLPLGTVTASAGPIGGNSLGTPLDFVVGDPQWAPNAAATVNGTADYYAQLTFDQPRNVTAVTLDWWATGSASLSKYTIQGSTDSTTFTDISALTSFSATSDHKVTSPVITVPGTYKAVRVLVKAGDYTFDSVNGRAPGLEGFDVRGSGTVSATQVNWANTPTFGTIVSNRGFATANGTRYTDGNLYDDESNTGRTGDTGGHWTTVAGSPSTYEYAQVDLTTDRLIDQVVLVWDSTHIATSVDLLYSLDGTNFQTLTQVGSPTFSGDPNVKGYMTINVQETELRYLRVTDATGTDGLQLLNQMMAFGDLAPEPASLSLLAAGGLLILRRRRSVE